MTLASMPLEVTARSRPQPLRARFKPKLQTAAGTELQKTPKVSGAPRQGQRQKVGLSCPAPQREGLEVKLAPLQVPGPAHISLTGDPRDPQVFSLNTGQVLLLS